jgi:cytochrome c biogenesis DsbD-like protein
VQAWLVALVAGTLAVAQQVGPPRSLLEVSSLVSADRVAVGERFTITLELTPAPNIHVYAPGVVGYKPIAFTVEPQRGLVIRPLTYPPSETYFYAPLKETVAVYRKPFRVVQELALDSSPSGRAALKEAASIVVRATLIYQACNDRLCFPPRTVPMMWTVAVKES